MLRNQSAKIMICSQKGSAAPNLLHPIHHLVGGPQRPAYDLTPSQSTGPQRRGLHMACTFSFSRCAACANVFAGAARVLLPRMS